MPAEPAPGQAAYEAFQRAFPNEDWGPWDSSNVADGDGHQGWEDIAKAAIHQRYREHLDGIPQRVAEAQAERDAARGDAASLREQLAGVEAHRARLYDEVLELRKAATESGHG